MTKAFKLSQEQKEIAKVVLAGVDFGLLDSDSVAKEGDLEMDLDGALDSRQREALVDLVEAFSFDHGASPELDALAFALGAE